MSTTSNVDRDQVDIAPYLLIRLHSCTPFPEECVGVEKSGRGDGGEIRRFMGVVGPDPVGTITGAPHWDRLADAQIVFPRLDYYSLRPGGAEHFALDLLPTPGFVYEVSIGLYYSSANTRHALWLPGIHRFGVPSKPILVHVDPEERHSARPAAKMMFDYDQGQTWKRAACSAFVARQLMFPIYEVPDPERPMKQGSK